METKDSNTTDLRVPQKEYITKEDFESRIKIIEDYIRELKSKIQNLIMLS